MMKQLAILAPVILLAGCNNITGDYGGADCAPYEKISLKKDGTAYITMLGNEVSAPYKVDGEKISIIVQGAGIVFTKKGDVLEAGQILGAKVLCKKL